MKKTAIYMRVSTDRQAQEGDSIPAQRDALMTYIKTHPDMVFVGEYLDDGISGTKYDRDELQRMLQDVEAGKINMILVTKMDRLHRSLRNFLNMQDVLDNNNCNWLAIWEPMYDTSTPQGRMIVNTMMNLAQFEAEQTSQRIRQVFRYKAESKEILSGKLPIGYSKTQDKGVVLNDKAVIIKDIFDYYNINGNLHRTTLYLADKYGIVRSQQAVKAILTNPKYTGKWYGLDDFSEPIVSTDLFDEVGRKLKMNVKNGTRHVYIFAGLLKCGECGGSFTGQTRYGTKQLYICRRHGKGGNCTNGHSIHQHILEKRLLANLRESLQNYIITVEEQQKEKPKNSKEKVSTLYKKIDRLKTLYINELIGLDEYKADKEKYLEEIVRLEKEAEEEKDLSNIKQVLEYDNIADLYETFTAEEKQFFWRSIIKEIRFYDSRHFDVIFL